MPDLEVWGQVAIELELCMWETTHHKYHIKQSLSYVQRFTIEAHYESLQGRIEVTTVLESYKPIIPAMELTH